MAGRQSNWPPRVDLRLSSWISRCPRWTDWRPLASSSKPSPTCPSLLSPPMPSRATASRLSPPDATISSPSREVVLQTQDGDFHLFKSDILAGLVTYSTDKNIASNLEVITAERAKEIIEMNRRGEKPVSLQKDGEGRETKKQHTDLLAGGDISRFDKAKKKKKKKNNANKQKAEGGQQTQNQQTPQKQEAPQKKTPQQQDQQPRQQRPPRPKKQRKPQQDAKE